MDFEKKESNNQSMKEKFKLELKMINRNIKRKPSYLRQKKLVHNFDLVASESIKPFSIVSEEMIRCISILETNH